MRVYERPYNMFISGSYVTIRNDQVEIVDNRYSAEILAEFYYHYVLINPLSMKVTMLNLDKEVLSVIHHAKRIVDMRTDEDE